MVERVARSGHRSRCFAGRGTSAGAAHANEVGRAEDLGERIRLATSLAGRAIPSIPRRGAATTAGRARRHAVATRAAMRCADANGTSWSRTSVSANSVSVVHPAAAPRAQAASVELGGAHRRCHQPNPARCIAEGREYERLQVVLGVDDVAERCIVHRGHDRLGLAKRLARDRARVLERDRVAFLRHDAAALHEPFTEAKIVELRSRPLQQVLDEAAQAHEQHASGRHTFEQVVDRGNAAVGVAGRTSKPSKSAVRSRSIGNPVPVIAHAPRGHRFVVWWAECSRTKSRSSCSTTASR